MTIAMDVAVIGAGPYGLSAGAHLARANVNACVFGQPMRFWRTAMPEGMVLKSEGFASNLSDPRGTFTLGSFCADGHRPYADRGLPIPLQTFCDYGAAFARQFVPWRDMRSVTRFDRDDDGFQLILDDGETATAQRVVLATGLGDFAYVPPELDALGAELCTHSTAHRSLDRFAGMTVLVIGGGASGVEMAGLISRKGAHVTVAARRNSIAFCGPPRERSLMERITEPETGLGTGWRSWACVEAPLLFHAMPPSFRNMIVRRHLGPAPGWTSREEVERNVELMLGATPVRSELSNGKGRVSFMRADGMTATVEADHVIAATGFRVDMRRLRFLSPAILRRLRMAENTPLLSPWFETSVPGLFVVGGSAANSFGPLLRFVYGAGFASGRLVRRLVRTSKRPAPDRPWEFASA